jgi:hypothetical protein
MSDSQIYIMAFIIIAILSCFACILYSLVCYPPDIDLIPTPVGVIVSVPQNLTTSQDVIATHYYAHAVASITPTTSVAQIDAQIYPV